MSHPKSTRFDGLTRLELALVEAQRLWRAGEEVHGLEPALVGVRLPEPHQVSENSPRYDAFRETPDFYISVQ
jgi:hypothetical protein